MSTYAKIKKGLLEAIRYERGKLDATVFVQTSGISEAALQYARSQVKDELLRIDPTLKGDTASCWAAEAVTMIDWNSDALMHKGLRWIAREIYERVALLIQCKMPETRTTKGSIRMIANEKKALETINRLSNWLGIPPEALTNSRMKVSGAIEDGELIWYEARHNGACWKLIHETECTYLAAGCVHPPEEFIYLEEPAVQWLSNLAANQLI